MMIMMMMILRCDERNQHTMYENEKIIIIFKTNGREKHFTFAGNQGSFLSHLTHTISPILYLLIPMCVFVCSLYILPMPKQTEIVSFSEKRMKFLLLSLEDQSSIDAIAKLTHEKENEKHEATPTSSLDHIRDGITYSLQRQPSGSEQFCWFYIAVDSRDDSPMGYMALMRIPKLDKRCSLLFVDDLYVSSFHRRKGVATSLLSLAKDMCKTDCGPAGVRLLVRVENKSAQQLYLQNGFSIDASMLGQWIPRE